MKTVWLLALIPMIALAIVSQLRPDDVTGDDSLQQPPADAVYHIRQNASVRFEFIEVWIDSGDQPLAAYQLVFQPTQGQVRIVGIEGGEHAAFADPPYYDPKAMMGDRVIIADFSTAAPESLPVGRTRIATIHVQVSGADEIEPAYDARLEAAATVGGQPIQVRIHLQTGNSR